MSYTNAIKLGPAHAGWLRSLDFYETELDILEGRLAEVTIKNTALDAREPAEHFQNQFIVQRNNIDKLKHAIHEHAHLVYEDIKEHVGRVQEKRVEEHAKIEGEVMQFEKVINELRHEFNTYVAKWI
ncbi:hypothetical protein BH11BAC4_BH11BAC4_17680 [soil metagenome]